jgi:hypothetical protein
MTETERAFSEREQIEMLLPWYVGGSLDATDRDRVEHYLAHHPDLRRQLDLIRQERRETIQANEALPTSSAGGLERLLAALPLRRPSLLEQLVQSQGYRAIVDFFSAPTPRAVRFAALAAASLLIVQAIALTTLLVRGDGAGCETAAGQDRSESLSFFIGFTDEASAAAISRLLGEFDARIVDGPKPGAIYKVKVRSSDPASAPDAVRRRLVERRDIVRFVLPAKE